MKIFQKSSSILKAWVFISNRIERKSNFVSVRYHREAANPTCKLERNRNGTVDVDQNERETLIQIHVSISIFECVIRLWGWGVHFDSSVRPHSTWFSTRITEKFLSISLSELRSSRGLLRRWNFKFVVIIIWWSHKETEWRVWCQNYGKKDLTGKFDQSSVQGLLKIYCKTS